MNTLKCQYGFSGSVCRRRDDEPVVQNGLAVTPGEMMRLTREGYSITSRNAMMLDAVDPADRDYYVPIQYRRGFDISDLSNHAAEVRDKLRSAVDKFDKGEIAEASPRKE